MECVTKSLITLMTGNKTTGLIIFRCMFIFFNYLAITIVPYWERLGAPPCLYEVRRLFFIQRSTVPYGTGNNG